jgi:radical SAM superfamily enzyme YgiQ (UPF0313 family)
MRIGLIAMSGIRACDAELLRLGLTLPGFVERSKTIASLPSLGLLTLAGMTPREHEVSYLEVPDIRQMGSLPGGFDLVAISSYSAQIAEAYELAKRYRDAGVPAVLGGPHVTCLPAEAASYCDAVVIGEGESVWPQVLADAAVRRLRPTYGSRDGAFDLADAPMPAFELLDISKYNRLTVQTSRGCPHLCEFCASSVLLADRYKQKPAGKVLAEIERILEIWKHPFIEFADDNSFVNKAYWRELLAALADKRIKWFAETDLSVAEDEPLLDLMCRAGCAQLLIGLESPTADALDGLETRSNWKYEQWSRYKDAIRTIQSHGITVNGCFVLGLDAHDAAIFDQVFEFVRDAELYEVQITIQTPFPGTPLYERLKREDRILRDGAWETCTLFDVNYRPTRMSPEQLASGFRQLGVRLYSEEFTKWRRGRFFCRRRKHK